MSYQRGLAAIQGRATDRTAFMTLIDQPEYLRQLTGIDPYERPRDAFLESCRLWDIDLLFGGPPAANTPRHKVVDTEISADGHTGLTPWGTGGTRWIKHLEFKSHREVLDFVPQQHDLYTVYGDFPAGKTVAQYAQGYADAHGRGQETMKEQTCIAGYTGTTLFQWLIAVFGWEPFMETAALYPDEFKDVIRRFVDMSRVQTEAWAQTNCLWFGSHDDLAMTRGPVFSPEWFRENIFCWYPHIWEPLKKKGVKIIMVSDGAYGPLVDDMAAAGADGFYMEYLVDLEMMATKFPKKILFGNTNPKVITFGTPQQVEQEVARCFRQAGHLPSYVFHPSGDIPHNVPAANLDALIAAFRKHAPRKA